jgi:hypothetical protein
VPNIYRLIDASHLYLVWSVWSQPELEIDTGSGSRRDEGTQGRLSTICFFWVTRVLHTQMVPGDSGLVALALGYDPVSCPDGSAVLSLFHTLQDC